MRERWSGKEFQEYIAGVGKKKKNQGGRVSHQHGVMNETERDYAEAYLEPARLAGESFGWIFEKVTIELAPDCKYTADFVEFAPDRCVFHEVKGAQVWEDSRIKFKWAKSKMIGYRFVWAQKKKSEWKRKIHEPGGVDHG